MISCPACGGTIPIGQSRLTDREIQRLPIGNQNTDRPTLIEWQVVKAAAEYYEVPDWTAKVDPELTAGENVDLLREKGTAEVPSAGKSLRRFQPHE